MSIGIYKITNNINGKCYIGQSVEIEKRWSRHISSSKDYPLYRAFKKYGIDNFSFEIIEETDVESLNERERFWIEETKSFLYGYNQTLGGEGGNLNTLTWEIVEDITKELKESSKTQKEIALKYGVSSEMINGMNTGRYYRRDIPYPIKNYSEDYKKKYCIDCNTEITHQATRCIECSLISRRVAERPPKDTLLKEVSLYGFSATGRKYGVSDNSIKKWCKDYGLPHLKKELVELYKKTV